MLKKTQEDTMTLDNNINIKATLFANYLWAALVFASCLFLPTSIYITLDYIGINIFLNMIASGLISFPVSQYVWEHSQKLIKIAFSLYYGKDRVRLDDDKAVVVYN